MIPKQARWAVMMRPHIWPIACILALVALLAFPHLSGQVIFIGDSDRLNTFLNIKLAEVIGIKELGHVAAWNSNSFMGFNMDGLYWTLPGWQPDVLFHALFPVTKFLTNAGYVTMALLFCAITFAYFYIYSVVGMRLASIAGACCYGFSALSIGRLSQVDTAYYTIVLMPIGMLAVRNLSGERWRAWGCVLAACIAIMFGMAFLQESAYVMLLMAAYAIHASWKSRSWKTIVIFSVAVIGAILIALPRVRGVAEEFALMFRTTNASGTPAIEILRVFHDGIFGRSFQEAWEVLGNVGFNGHEGVQLYSSTVAACLLFMLPFLVNQRKQFGTLFVFMVVCALIVFYASHLLGAAAFMVVAYLAIRFIMRAGAPVLEVNSETELEFHVLALCTVLAVVLVPPARAVLHILFLKIDFLHARAIVASLLPFSVIIALLLGAIGKCRTASRPLPNYVIVLLALVSAGFVSAISFTISGWQEGWTNNEQRVPFRFMSLNKGVLIQALTIAAATVCAMVLFIRKASNRNSIGAVVYVVLASVAVSEGLSNAQYRMFGEHTKTFPVAFRSGNYFSAPSNAFDVPSAACRETLRRTLDADRYRSITISDPSQYFAYTGPFLSQFWQQRFLDGYPGLPKALAELPWPPGIASLRSLTFRDTKDLPWDLLAILGVKYALPVSEAIYFNVPEAARNGSQCGFENMVPPVENPYIPIPRQFFASSARSPSLKDSIETSVFGLRARAVDPGTAEIEWDSMLRDGNLEIQKRAKGAGKFERVALLSPTEATIQRVHGLAPGGTYEFRLRKHEARGSPEVYTQPVVLQLPAIRSEPPRVSGVTRESDSSVKVHWDPQPSAIAMRLEVRRGVLEEFKLVAEVPADKGFTRLMLSEPFSQNALRLQAVLPGSVSAHSEVFYLGSKADLIRPALDILFGPNPGTDVIAEGTGIEGAYAAEGDIVADFKGSGARFEFAPMSKDRFLVVNEMFHPRWLAFVDGQSMPVFRTNRLMMGVLIPKGATTVQMRFEPVTRQWGTAAFALLGVLVLAGALYAIARCPPVRKVERNPF